MTEKELRKMRPQDIIQLLVVQGNEASQLQAELDLKNQKADLFRSNNEVLRAKLNDRDALTELLKIRLDISDARIREHKGKMDKERAEQWIEIEEAGSIEKASRQLEAIFKAAQQEANQYMGIEEEEEPEEEIVEEVPMEEQPGGMLIMPSGAQRMPSYGQPPMGMIPPNMQTAGGGVMMPDMRAAARGAVPPNMRAAGGGVMMPDMRTAAREMMPPDMQMNRQGMQSAAGKGATPVRPSGARRPAVSGMQGAGRRSQPSGPQNTGKRTAQPGVQSTGRRTSLSGGQTAQPGGWIDAGIMMPDIQSEAGLAQPDMRIAEALGLSSVHVAPQESAGALSGAAGRKAAVKKANKGLFGTLRTRKRRS